jgi:hypothetical protein
MLTEDKHPSLFGRKEKRLWHLMSGEMNQSSSVINMRQIKTMQQIEMTAPVRVGWVRSFGTFR